MTDPSDRERLGAVSGALNVALTEAYDSLLFSVRAFGEMRGWV